MDITAEHAEFLRDIRDSGHINPLASTQALQQEFGLNRHEARRILLEWMRNPEIYAKEILL